VAEDVKEKIDDRRESHVDAAAEAVDKAAEEIKPEE